jgi:hypothetical protein
MEAMIVVGPEKRQMKRDGAMDLARGTLQTPTPRRRR